MLYFRAKQDAYDYFNKHGVVEGELLTPTERNTKVRYLADHVFDIVKIRKCDVFTNFGVRLPKHGVIAEVVKEFKEDEW